MSLQSVMKIIIKPHNLVTNGLHSSGLKPANTLPWKPSVSQQSRLLGARLAHGWWQSPHSGVLQGAGRWLTLTVSVCSSPTEQELGTSSHTTHWLPSTAPVTAWLQTSCQMLMKECCCLNYCPKYISSTPSNAFYTHVYLKSLFSTALL